MSRHGRNACASLRVTSADDLYREWKDKVAIKRPPINEEWGCRTFGVQDPFGKTLSSSVPSSAKHEATRLRAL